MIVDQWYKAKSSAISSKSDVIIDNISLKRVYKDGTTGPDILKHPWLAKFWSIIKALDFSKKSW